MAEPVSIDALLASRSVWRAGQAPAQRSGGEPTGHAGLDALLPEGGWPQRAITELLLPADGVGELSLLQPTLGRISQAGGAIALIAPPYIPYAPAWHAAGVDLGRLWVIEAGRADEAWAFEQCLRSGAFSLVLGWLPGADARVLRRLQVAAAAGRCLGFVLRDRAQLANPSPAPLRLEAVPAPDGTQWWVRKCRGGPLPGRAFVPACGSGRARVTTLPRALPLARVIREQSDLATPPTSTAPASVPCHAH